MRRGITVVFAAMLLLGVTALPALAPNEKFTFEDVTLPDGQTGEIEAGVKVLKNKDDSITCSYFSDDYEESLGYYFAHVQPAPLEGGTVLDFCLDNFDERHS
ncbi:MAG: hypothetical protein ACLFWM_11320 [Actinomycetota bacterium]